MDSKTILATIAGVFALVATVWGSVTVFDNRYVAASQFEQLQKGVDDTNIILLKGRIYDARKDLIANPDNQVIKDYLQGLIDELCVKKPDDPECKTD